MDEFLALSSDVRSTDRWLRQFYAEVEDVRKILFTPGRTAKGAKRLLK